MEEKSNEIITHEEKVSTHDEAILLGEFNSGQRSQADISRW